MLLAAVLPTSEHSTAALAIRLGVAFLTLLRMVWTVQHLITRGGLAYMLVLAAMVCAALLARLPTPWTALGAVCFAVSDAMIGISEFIRRDQALAVPIWWAYAAAMVLIVAGLIFGRSSVGSATPST